ncbi:MAG: cytochrome d ubiquinol oxidase subunit II [Bacteroidota bacterium]|nr:cytochrome d ubiquinol oxidase subunit II [Bacteroidota bacterium]
MRRNSIFVISLAVLAIIDGYLLSAISFIGRAGISLFYTQYQFFKTWWKGALLVYASWFILFVIQSMLQKSLTKLASKLMHVSLIIIAAAGLYLSYSDFRNSLSHRWLGERFHLGVYLFWLVWIAISIFMLLKPKTRPKN